MAKKSFKNGINDIFGTLTIDSDTKNTTMHTDHTESKIKTIRTTIFAKKTHMDAIKAIAFWERRTITDVLNESISMYIEKYKYENGEIKIKN